MAVPAVSTVPPPVCVGVVTFHPQTGDTFYAQAQMEFCGKNLILEFQTATQPFSEMKQYFQEEGEPPFEMNEQESPSCMERIAYFYLQKPGPLQERVFKQCVGQVQNVFINLHLPSNVPQNTSSEIPRTYIAVIDRIGEVCRESFPNLRPHTSAYNVHMSFLSYRADYYLTSGQAAKDPVMILPK